MQDRPTLPELLEAVRGFICDEILPTLHDHRLRFRCRVAANLLEVMRRELALEPSLLRREHERLAALLGAPVTVDADADLAAAVQAQYAALCQRIRAGSAPPDTRAALTDSVRGKLEVANPRYLDGFEPV
ncbi:MAG: hypothetical protein Kow0073_15630 [Immundisolibacter sp.]